VEERDVEDFQHVEHANRGTSGEFWLAQKGACVTRTDSGMWSGRSRREKMLKG